MSEAFEIREPIRSESAMLAGGTRDALVSVRLCRYPSVGVAWVWAHVWLPDIRLNYNVDVHSCSREPVDVEGPDAVYEATDIACSLRRHGPRSGMARGDLVCELAVHRDDHPPNRSGAVPVRLEAVFTPGRMSGDMYGGTRQEVRGTVEATVRIDGRDVRVEGSGHWHEQHQDAPRWLWPFTYVSLVGEGVSLVCTRGPRRAQGFARRGDDVLQVTELDIDPPAAERRLRITLDDGSSIQGTARVVHENSVYIYGRRRAGTYVTLDSGLEGTINDWEGMR